MQNIKKYFMTLALLLTAVTGAWAEEKMVTINSSTMSSGAVTATGFNIILENYLYVNKNPATIATSEGVITKLVIKKSDVYVDAFTEANVGVTPGTITYGSDEITVTDINAESVTLSRKGDDNWSTSSVDVYYGAPAAYPFPITWDATNKTTGFNLPAGNVFMNVEYYPVAKLTTAPAAKSDIKATTDDAIVTAGTVAKIGETENAQGTLMYYAVQSETVPDAPDYDNQGWSDKVPTAADFNQGNVYVWYYVKGADGDAESTFNDGAITKLGETGYVTLAAPPTYAITLKEDTEEADKWTISSAEATKGTTITATYSGSRKVKSVKAVKKGGAAGIVNPVVGQIIGSDGKNYDANATLPDGVTKVAMIAYVGDDAETSTTNANFKNGLALALEDASTSAQWCSQTTGACLVSQKNSAAEALGDMAGIFNTNHLILSAGSHTHSAATAARQFKYVSTADEGAHPTGTSAWFLPSAGQWDKMAAAAGSYENLKTNAGLQPNRYWSSTEYAAQSAWYFNFDAGNWYNNLKEVNYLVRACLAFDIAEPTEWDLTSEDGKTWTLAKMPASDIELQVEYYPESNIFLGKEALADKANIAVKNGETAVAFDEEGKSTTTVSEGNTVTAKFTGKKVIGMTVTKRVSLAYPIVISEVTDEAYIGSVVAADGYVYATEDDVVNASKTPVAKICYVGSETGDATYKHGLALALRDVSEIKSWCSQNNNTCLVSQYTTVAEAKGDLAGIANTDVLVGTTPHSHGDNAAKAARGYNSGTHPDGTSEWFLPSVGQWDKMATAVGDYGKLGLNSGNYWSSTEIDAENAWSVNGGSWSTDKKYYNQGIRACLAF